MVRIVGFKRSKLMELARKFLQFAKGYACARQALWFWATIFLATAGALSSIALPEGSYPMAYLRQVLGSIFLFLLPGYTLIKVFFPKHRESNIIEQLALSIGLSLAVIPTVGLLLNYTLDGLNLIPISLSLFGLAVISATAALALNMA